MLFYVALAFASVIVAAIMLWLLRATFEASRAVYRAILPSARQNRPRERFKHLNSNLRNTPDPWGWHGTDGARHASFSRGMQQSAKPGRAMSNDEPGETVPWGWPGSAGLQRSNREMIREGIEKSAAVTSLQRRTLASAREQVGWPYRPEPAVTGGESSGSKTNRKASRAKKLKPWGW